MSDRFTDWAGADSHVGTDIRVGRRSLATALELSERGGPGGGPAFEWDIMMDVGDLSGSQGAPDDEEGTLVQEQYAVLRDHDRSQIYNICGNHDANTPDEPCQWRFKKYGDPLGENTEHSGVATERRPFPVAGQWDRQRIDFGNVTVLMMSDRTDGGPMGAGYLYQVDGNSDAQAFERYLAANPGAIDLWIGGHTHTHPGDVKNGRRHIEEKWSVTFLNCAALTQCHIDPAQTGCPMSRPLTFTPGV